MYSKFQDIKDKMFAKREVVTQNLPTSFRNPLLRHCRVVIDCTEIFVESSSDFRQTGNLYSSYKSHTTGKVLIGVSPSGACMFVSDVFEGSISDKQICIQSKFISYIEEGDCVLADRGFLIEDLLVEKGAKLVIPSFLKQRGSFPLEETQESKMIARARIHVERFNERMKNYKILSGIISHHFYPMLSQIVYVICCLTNFQEPLNEK